MANLFKKNECYNCHSRYDVTRKTCPVCLSANDKFNELKIDPKTLWLSWPSQLGLFLIGFFGLSVLGSILSSIFANSGLDVYLASIIINSIAYLVVLGALIPIIFPHIKDIFNGFKSGKNIAMGFAFLGMMLASNFIYNLIVYVILKQPQSVNNNEGAIESIVSIYPVASLLIFGIVGPICEELTYRLGLFTFFKRINRVLAYILTIIIFASIHFDFSSFANPEALRVELLALPTYVIAGFLLTFAYDKFSLSTSLIAHIANNVTAMLLQLIMARFA